MTDAIDWVVEDDHGGPADAAEPADTAVMLTIPPLDGRPGVGGDGPGPAAVADRLVMAARRDRGYLAACWASSSA